MNTKEKLSVLRAQMKANGIDAFVVYSADPHASEYLPVYWLERAWISGFTGSAGLAVITMNKAGVWTDSRYFVQAAEELQDSGFELFKEGVEGTPSYIDWLVEQVPTSGKVAVNGLCCSHTAWELVTHKLANKSATLVDNPLLAQVWKERPADKKNPIFIQPVAYAGKSVQEKLTAIRNQMATYEATFHVVTTLDDIAWITNLRGSDVAYNPVFVSYLVITPSEAKLFTDLDKCDSEVQKHLSEVGINLLPYDRFFSELTSTEAQKVLISGNANQSVYEALKGKNTFVEAEPPSQMQKATKNTTELQGFRTAMKKDAVAMVYFLHWLDTRVGKEAMDEYSIGRTLEDFRSKQENFVGNSFGEIVGYQGNGAIVHYSAKKETAKEVLANGTILIDSGGQYREGTTDITRVIPLGEYTDEFKYDYTLVLQGMIDLSMTKFVKGTRGVQLDAFARMPLWRNHRDYGHGTGHGVGSFLNVHEGPQNIRKDLRDIPLLEGMVCSNEPGLYRENKYGIRIENLVAVQKDRASEFGEFYQFETLTLCPIDTRPILTELLTPEQKDWLNAYHARVEKEIAPLLPDEQRDWLTKACKSI